MDKKVIGVVQVLQDLKDGLTRADIAEKYNITKSECKLLFQDSRLKGKKTIAQPTFTLVEDATADIAVKTEEVVADKPEPTVELVDDADVVEEDTKETTDDVAVGPGNDTAKAVEPVAAEDNDSAKANWD